jgi:hypothetical protein
MKLTSLSQPPGSRSPLRSPRPRPQDAKLDPGDLKPLVRSVRELAKSDRTDVHQAVQNAREALKTLKASAAPKS